MWVNCDSIWNMRVAGGKEGEDQLPLSRGKHLHLNRSMLHVCEREMYTVLKASAELALRSKEGECTMSLQAPERLTLPHPPLQHHRAGFGPLSFPLHSGHLCSPFAGGKTAKDSVNINSLGNVWSRMSRPAHSHSSLHDNQLPSQHSSKHTILSPPLICYVEKRPAECHGKYQSIHNPK